jgi:molecular chaperone DnaJ
MDINKNYYDILGVNKESTDDEIKKEYRKKAIKTHPDKHGGNDNEFKELNEAYQVLGDKGKKDEYDLKSPHGKNYNPSSGFFDGFMNFGTGFNPFDFFFKQKQDFFELLDIEMSLNITLKDVYNNINKEIKYNRDVSCDECMGTGFDFESKSDECEVCNGSGKIWEPIIGYNTCKYCHGKGRIYTGTCKKCNGKKVIKKEEKFFLNNTYMIYKDDVKYIQGYGNQSKYYQNKKGNLILSIIYEHDDKYIRKKDGLYYKMDVHYMDVINGTFLNYKHLDGKEYKITIPPKTSDGDILNMKKMGLLVGSEERQNLFILVNVIVDYDRE